MAPKDKQTPRSKPAAPASAHEGERIAKVLSRRGIASRRDAERLIAEGEVRVNGKVIDSPALNVTAKDRITVSGQPLPEAEPARLWLYYKPEGLVTSAADEKGRDTVFDHLPEDMPRVMSVGRLDLNSEGLLLLTNDGELKRRLELPSTGWLRKYRVRVNGNPLDPQLQPLREGITIDGERFLPMQVSIDRIQGANAWLTVGLREGRNREIRRAMNAIGLYVNRLIRTSYGPFRLGDLEPGQVSEVKQKVLRDQLGESGDADEVAEKPAARPARGPAGVPPRAKTSRIIKVAASSTSTRTAASDRREGAATRRLAEAWDEATTPRPGPKVRAPRGTKAAEESPAPRRFGTAAKRSAEAAGGVTKAPRSASGTAERGSGASARKPATKPFASRAERAPSERAAAPASRSRSRPEGDGSTTRSAPRKPGAKPFTARAERDAPTAPRSRTKPEGEASTSRSAPRKPGAKPFAARTEREAPATPRSRGTAAPSAPTTPRGPAPGGKPRGSSPANRTGSGKPGPARPTRPGGKRG